MRSEQILNDLYKHKFMCIFRVNEVDENILVKASLACVQGGARFIEITYNHEEYEEKTLQVISKIKNALQGQAYVGAGTILNLDEAKRVVASGADFIVAPTLSKQVLHYAKEQDIYYMPGIFTASEACEAYSDGAKLVKLFPTGEVGLDYAKALMKPLGFIKYFAVGKMTPEFFEECMKLGFAGAGISSSINQKEILLSENYDLIRQKVQVYAEIAKRY